MLPYVIFYVSASTLIIACIILANYLDNQTNFKRTLDTMKQVNAVTNQQLNSNVAILAQIESMGFFELYATSLATSKDSQGIKAMYNGKNPQLVTLRSSAQWAWDNLGHQASLAIVTLGRHIDANQDSYSAKLDPVSGNYVSPLNFWRVKNNADAIHSLFATIGFRPSGNVVSVSVASVAPTPTPQVNGEAYPKLIEASGVVFKKANKPAKSDGSVIYAGGDANSRVTVGQHFSDNGLTYVITSVKFGGKNIDVKLVATPTPSVAKHVKPMQVATPTPSVAPTVDPVLALLQSLVKRLDDAGI